MSRSDMTTRITKRQRSAPPRRNATAPYLSELNRGASPQGRIKWTLADQRGRNAYNVTPPRSRGSVETEHHKATVALYRIEGRRDGAVVRVLETASTKGLVAIVHSLESDGLETRFKRI